MAALKIVALIGTPVHLHYFVNRVAEDHDIALVIREDVRSNLWKKVKERGWGRSLAAAWKILKNRRREVADYNACLGTAWQRLKPSLPLLTVTDINSAEVARQLQDLKPDLVIVQGTTLLKDKTLAGVPLVLNLHWGLSPYYRGSYCTEWAILNKDTANIGYTIHRISDRIDGGDIYTQGRPQITQTDTAHRINMKLTREGAAAMSAAITHLKGEGRLPFVGQDVRIGALYLTRHWTSQQQRLLKESLRNGLPPTGDVSKPLPIVVAGKLSGNE